MSLTIDPKHCLDEATAARVAEGWTAVYPAMRRVLDDVIRANRNTDRPLVNVRRVERVRRELGQIDRGTHRPCTQSPPAFSPRAAYGLVRYVLRLMPVGHPHAGDMYRLAAELADVNNELDRRRRQAADAA